MHYWHRINAFCYGVAMVLLWSTCYVLALETHLLDAWQSAIVLSTYTADWQQQEILQILVWNLDPKELHYFTALLKVRGHGCVDQAWGCGSGMGVWIRHGGVDQAWGCGSKRGGAKPHEE